MASQEGRFLAMLKKEAWAIACTSAPWETQLCTELEEFFDDTVFLHVVNLTRTGRWSLRVASWVDSPIRLTKEEPRHGQTMPDLRAHPGVATMFALGTAGPIRLSDILDLPRFRDTAVFHATHSYPADTRFASAAPLFRTPEQLILLGAHGTRRDFSAEQMDHMAQLQSVLSHALTIRTELQRLVDTAKEPTSPSPQPMLPRQVPETDYWPSSREQQVLRLLVLGMTSRQIARRLDITERTVRKHLDSIYQKAHLSGRAAAAAWWQRHAS